MRNNALKLEKQIWSGYKEEFPYSQVGEALARLPREAVDLPSQEAFKAGLHCRLKSVKKAV